MFKCLICEDVYMCAEHSIHAKCLESFARICCRHSRYTPGRGSWNPKGGYPKLEGLPNIPKQERWQDVDDVLSKHGDVHGSDEEDFRLTSDLTAGSSPTVTNLPCGGTSANGGKFWRASMSGAFSSGLKDTRHMAEHTGPYALSDPESDGLVRLYPSSRPRSPIGSQKPYPWMENMHPIAGESTCPAEQGCYPLSVVKRLPDVIPGEQASHRQLMVMERKALCEFLKTPNPDEYPWPGAPEFIDPYCKNNDPEKGPMNCDLWYNY
eukprot:631414-Amphidinium_carterae.2